MSRFGRLVDSLPPYFYRWVFSVASSSLIHFWSILIGGHDRFHRFAIVQQVGGGPRSDRSLQKKKGPRNEKKAVPKEIQQQQQQQQQKGTKTREFQPKSVRLIAARYFDAAPADEFTGEPGGGWGWVGGGWVATGVATASRVVCPLATSPHQQCPGANRWRQSITEQRVSTPTTPSPHPLALSPNGAHIHETVGPDFDWPR